MRSFVSEYDLVIASDLGDALDRMSANEGWRPIAGGTDLMVLFNAGKLPFQRLVSIRDVTELRQIEVANDHVMIGAGVTYSRIRDHQILLSEFPLLCQAAGWTGGIANQNRGTLGGNIANASPAADSSPVLLAYGAELELTSRGGVRWVPYAQFHLAYKQMQLRPDELITRIRLPRTEHERLQYGRKVGARKAQAISKVCLAAVAENYDGWFHNFRIAVGSVGPVPLRCFETERILNTERLTPAVLGQAKKMIASEIRPITDIRSTGEYRASVTVNLLGEFLESLH